jgi:hypothetical protein
MAIDSSIHNYTNPFSEYDKRVALWKIKYLSELDKLVAAQSQTFIYSNFFTRNTKLNFEKAYRRGDRVVFVNPFTVCDIYDIIQTKNWKVNLTLVTLGHDSIASPMNDNRDKMSTINDAKVTHPNYKWCFQSLLNHSIVERYFVNQHMSPFTHPKLKFAPIGMGRSSLKSKLTWSQMKTLITVLKNEHMFNHINHSVEYNIVPYSVNTNGNDLYHENTLSRNQSLDILNHNNITSLTATKTIYHFLSMTQ